MRLSCGTASPSLGCLSLIALVGFTFFIGRFLGTHVPVIVGLSFWFGDLFRVLLAQTGLAYPTGRVRSRVAWP